jgi:hypothetical protein
MAQDIGIGDEVMLTVTILKLLGNGRASVSIPSYSFPFSIEPPPKAKRGDKLQITGEVTHVDHDADKVTVKIGGVVKVDADRVSLLKKYRPPLRRTPLGDRPD